MVLHDRAVTEMPADGPPEPVAQFAQGGEGVRIGLLPAKYDPERRKMLWYWFIAHAANGNVRIPALNGTCLAVVCSLR